MYLLTNGSGLEFILNFVGILSGIIAVIIFSGSREHMGARVWAGANLVVWGVAANIFAMVWDIAFAYMKNMPHILEDVHPLFVIIGMIFFIRAAQKFSEIGSIGDGQ